MASEEICPLPGKNHSEICRIGHKEDLAFQMIVGHCKEIAQGAAVDAAVNLRCKLPTMMYLDPSILLLSTE